MNIGILTQPLIHNYGGTLQNYAMQEVLKHLGHNPTTINWGISNSWLKWALHNLIYAIKGQPLIQSPSTIAERDRYFNQFHSKYIYTTKPMGLIDPNLVLSNKFDGYIVGSDQVWRRAYNSQIQYMFLNFLPEGIKRMAYAASIGIDSWDYSQTLTEICKKSLKKFDLVTVREASAIALLRDNANIESHLVLDPTLLLKLEDYEKRLNLPARQTKPEIVVYMLDFDENKVSLLRRLSESMRLTINVIGSSKYNRSFNMLDHGVYPPIEKWIVGIRDAEYVITDSFHGTAFAINFHKQFITLQNSHRGNTRFDSLLGLFGLQSRLFDNTQDLESIVESLTQPIEWADVETLRSSLAETSTKCIKTVFPL